MMGDYFKTLQGLKNGTLSKPEKPKPEPISKRSEKMKEEMKLYKPQVKEYLARPENEFCGIRFKGCTGKAVCVHCHAVLSFDKNIQNDKILLVNKKLTNDQGYVIFFIENFFEKLAIIYEIKDSSASWVIAISDEFIKSSNSVFMSANPVLYKNTGLNRFLPGGPDAGTQMKVSVNES